MAEARARVGVNLAWLMPGVVGGSEDATVAALAAARPIAEREGIEIVLLLHDEVLSAHPELARFQVSMLSRPPLGRLGRVVAESLWLDRLARDLRLDLLHQAGGVVPPGCSHRSTLTVHDIQPIDLPANFSFLKRTYLGRLVPRSVRRAEVTMVPSAFVAGRLAQLVPGSDPRIVPWCLPESESRPGWEPTGPDALAERYGLGARSFLYPAITYRHKNHAVLIEALSLLGRGEVQLVLAGGAGPEEAAVRNLIEDRGLDGTVLRVGRVPRRDLLGMYRYCTAVLFPSLYEGFGLPVLEAMREGAPVVVSDRGSLPELVGPGGSVLPATDRSAWSAAMASLVDDAGVRKALAENGTTMLETFSPRRTGLGLVMGWLQALDLEPRTEPS